MEVWETARIDSNLHRLAKLTRCTNVLTAFLRSKMFITAEDEEKLTALRSHYGEHRAATELYEIIKTRRGGYQVLLEVLQETCQSGALHILKCKLQESCNEDTHAVQLLDYPLQIAEQVTSFRKLIPGSTAQDALKILRDAEIDQEFSKMLEEEEHSLQLDGQIPLIHKLYIPRCLSNRLLLNPDVFQKPGPDVFVFKGIEKRELALLVEPHVVRSSTYQRTKITCRHIYLDDDEDWDDIVIVCKSPTHLVFREFGDYILQRSTCVTDTIIDNSLNQSKPKHTYITEDSFLSQFSENHETESALFCDVPGMGKTWFMQNIAYKLRNKTPHAVVLFAQMSSFCEFLIKNNDQLTHPLDILLSYVLCSKLAIRLLTESICKNKCKIVICLDGFDEIREAHTEIVLSFIKDLNSQERVQLMVSSRPHMRKLLEKTFQLLSYDILPFGRQEQVRAIVEHWTDIILHPIDQLLVQFANCCIDAIKQLRTKANDDILGVPLKCYLLAVLNEAHARQICKPNRRKQININEIKPFESVVELFHRFVNVSLDKTIRIVFGVPKDSIRMRVFNFHIFKALELLYPELANAYFISFKIDCAMEEVAKKAGVLQEGVHSELEFIHRSFAEYFVGKFFAEFWMNVGSCEPRFRQTVSVYFVKDILCKTDIFTFTTKHHRRLLISSGVHAAMYYFDTLLLSHRHRTMLWFMSHMYQVQQLEHLNPVYTIFQNEEDISLCRKHLLANSYVIILTFVIEGFTSLMSLMSQLFKALFTQGNQHDIFLPTDIDTEIIEKFHQSSIPLVLCLAASKGTPELTQELFGIFENSENFLLNFCRNYPAKFVSPLEIAVWRNDPDMANFFTDKLRMPAERLFLACLTVGRFYEIKDIEVLFLIMETVGVGVKTILDIMSAANLKLQQQGFNKFKKMNPSILVKFALRHDMSAKSVSLQNRQFLCEVALRYHDDEEIVELLCWLFAKPGPNHNICFTSDFGSGSSKGYSSGHTAKAILPLLDMESAKMTFSSISNISTLSFRYMEKLETLKILTAICPDFSHSNKRGWNYLQFFVSLDKPELIKYLIDSEHDVNQKDNDGNPPLV